MNTWDFTRLIEKIHSGEITELPIDDAPTPPSGMKDEASHTADTQPVNTGIIPAQSGGRVIGISFTVTAKPPPMPDEGR